MSSASPELNLPGDGALAAAEETFTNDFQTFTGLKRKTVTPTQARQGLQSIAAQTGIKPALLYVRFRPISVEVKNDPLTPALKANIINDNPIAFPPEQWQLDERGQIITVGNQAPDPSSSLDDQLELILVTPDGPPIQRQVPINRSEMMVLAQRMRAGVTNFRRKRSFLRPSQSLYDAMIRPIQADLEQYQITNLGFLMDRGLRGIPIAALHDGNDFLVKNYSVGLMPSLSMTELDYGNLKDKSVLAMGADTFPDKFPLPAVPIEIDTISNKIWRGASFLNEEFTLANLQQSRAKDPYGILHLATHAEFNPGSPANSYIQLGDQKLNLNQLNQLGLNDPPIELIVLSACRTALGDDDAEMGFAGLAIMAGVKSALGSLWSVSDEGTLGLMMSFYQDLRSTTTKAEALREAQLSMINGNVYIDNHQLVTPEGPIPLPPVLSQLDDRDFSHPYYWSGFTMIGSPW